MKTLLLKFAPGVVVCLASILIVAFLRAQSATSESTAVSPFPVSAAAPTAGPVVSLPNQCLPVSGEPRFDKLTASEPQQIVLCGHCGAQVAAPAQVLIAMPVPQPRGAYHGDRRVEPVRYVAPYYGSPGTHAQFMLLEQSGYYERNGYPVVRY
jgi:hypothetical protein